MLLNIILNLYLIPLYGINGAAWATFLSYIVISLPTIYIYLISNNIGIYFVGCDIFDTIENMKKKDLNSYIKHNSEYVINDIQRKYS